MNSGRFSVVMARNLPPRSGGPAAHRRADPRSAPLASWPWTHPRSPTSRAATPYADLDLLLNESDYAWADLAPIQDDDRASRHDRRDDAQILAGLVSP